MASRLSKCRLTTPPDRPRHPKSGIAREPERFNAECKAGEIKRGSKRLEVCAIRLAACDAHLKRPRWASAAAYIADHPDKTPTLLAAVRLIRKTPNGITGLSELYGGAQHKQTAEPVDMTEWADAQLEGIVPDAAFDALEALATSPPAYTMAVVRLMPDGSNRIWLVDEADGFGEPAIRRAVKKVKSRAILEDGPRAYIERSIGAAVQREARTVLDAVAHDKDGDEYGPSQGEIEAEPTKGDAEDKPRRSDTEGDSTPRDIEDKPIGGEGGDKPVASQDKRAQASTPKHSRQPASTTTFSRRLTCVLGCGCQYAQVCRKQRRCLAHQQAEKSARIVTPAAAAE